MKLFIRCSLFASLGAILSVSTTLADSQSPVSFNKQSVGSRYHAVRSASRFARYQAEDEDTEVGEDLAPIDDDAGLEPAPADTMPLNDVPVQQAPIYQPQVQRSPAYPDNVGSGNYNGACNTGSCGSTLSGNYYGDQCYGAQCSQCGPCGWFGGVYGLIMAREDDWGSNLNYNSNNGLAPILKTNDGFSDYEGGFDVHLGKYFANGCYGWEVSYFGIYPDNFDAYTYQSDLGGGGLYNSLGFDNILYDRGANVLPVGQMYGNATQSTFTHRLRRSYEVHNVEFNLIRNPQRRTKCFNYELLAGFRYFRFNDGMIFSSDYTSATFGDDPVNELDYGIDVDNDLFGFQLGGRFDHYINQCWSVNVGTKFGIYNNHINHQQYISGGNGLAYESLSGNATDYSIESSDDDVAFLGELSAGLSYDYGCHWRFTGGYRVLSACGIATSDGQIPRARDFAALNQGIYSDECLVLHGGYLGVEYNW